jgi:HD-like signal output (HDOD) protein
MQSNAGNPDLSTLKKIRSLELFSDDQLNNLAQSLTINVAKPGSQIIVAGDTGSYSLYILSGDAISRAVDGITLKVKTMADGWLQPIAQLRPSLYDVDAINTVHYLEISDEILSELSKALESEHPEVEIQFIDQGETANRLTNELFQDILSENIRLPTLPDIVAKVQQEFARDDYDVDRIQELIQSDPVITAYLIKYANSPLYQGSSPVESLHQAIVRLGMKAVQKHVIIIATTRLFQEKSVGMKDRMRQLWKSSRRVAAFSRVLAAKSGIFDPDAAQMAGLLSDLGVIAILEYAQEHSDQYDDENTLDQTVKALRPQINSMLLQNWNLGDELVTVGEESRSWFRNNSVSADLCDLILIARYHSYLGTEHAGQLPLLSKMPAFEKLKLTDFGSQDSLEFMKESQDEVAAIEQMLGTI